MIKKLLQELVKIRSFSGREGKLADFIMSYCRENNIPAKLQHGNTIIHLQGEDNSKALVFNAHLDTVKAGDISKWKYPPFGHKAGVIKGGKLYGLGASDAKGAIASMLFLAKSYCLGSKAFKTPKTVRTTRQQFDLWFTFVVKEETDGSGTADFLDWFISTKHYKRYKSIAVVIGEPTNLASLEIGHRGNAFVKVEVLGKSGHGGSEYKQKDLAIESIVKLLGRLKQHFQTWKRQYRDGLLGAPTMNITSIYAFGGAPNRVADKCIAEIDIRTTPSFEVHIDSLLDKVIGSIPGASFTKIGKPPGLIGPKSPIVSVFRKAIPNLPLTTSFGSTDICQFAKHDIDAVVFGPGEKDTIHKENEYICLSKVIKCVKLYKRVIENYSI